MVGLGARDSLGMAEDFVSDHGTTFPMLWDENGASWRRFRVPSQPAALLVAADGRWIRRWSGEFPEDEVLELVREPAATSAP